jgi:hypothetical protein
MSNAITTRAYKHEGITITPEDLKSACDIWFEQPELATYTLRDNKLGKISRHPASERSISDNEDDEVTDEFEDSDPSGEETSDLDEEEDDQIEDENPLPKRDSIRPVRLARAVKTLSAPPLKEFKSSTHARFIQPTQNSNILMNSSTSKVCDICKQIYSNQSNLRRHQMSAHEKLMSTCYKCRQTFTRRSNLNKHEEICSKNTSRVEV